MQLVVLDITAINLQLTSITRQSLESAHMDLDRDIDDAMHAVVGSSYLHSSEGASMFKGSNNR